MYVSKWVSLVLFIISLQKIKLYNEKEYSYLKCKKNIS